jgi:hypothetical protein
MSDQHIVAIFVSFSSRFGECGQPLQSFTLVVKHGVNRVAVLLRSFQEQMQEPVALGAGHSIPPIGSTQWNFTVGGVKTRLMP